MLATSLLTFPDIDPVLISIGPVAIRWYALAYIAGIVLGYWFIKRINRRDSPPLLTAKQIEDMMVWAILGIMLGGRLGYVIFYKAGYYLAHPLEIFAIWQGGMSFHGGMIGVILAFWFFARKHHIPYLRLMDLIACAAPIGLFFGRLANFINGELYGRITASPLGMIFPHGGPLPRHPSQIYEAALEGLLLFAILFLLVTCTRARQFPGLLGGVFLAGYGCARAFVELYREPDAHLGYVVAHISMGQLLCVPMIVGGLYLIATAKGRSKPF